jgi:hypothetical protein
VVAGEGLRVTRRPWTDIEDRVMREFYPHLTGRDMADVLKRTEKAVYQRAKHLKLAKSLEFLASDRSGRVARGKQHPAMVASQFKPGLQPWNKGKPSTQTGTGHHPNSRRTQFKADGSLRGAAQHNYVPVGSLRVSKDGYLERKVTDDHPVPARRWVAVHRLVWEAERGPIPVDHIVRFKPGQKTTVLADITADRLECITRAEHAHRNHPRNRDPELGRLVQLKGAITRQVNRIAREAQEATA